MSVAWSRWIEVTYFVFLQSEYDNESIAEDLRNGDEMSLRILGENDCSATPAHIETDQFCWKYCPLLAGSGHQHRAAFAQTMDSFATQTMV
jgi:hypothetical protein